MDAYHIPVLLNESLNGLDINPKGVYVDATFGGGGHSREILRRLGNGRLFAFDQDKDSAGNVINDDRFFFILHNFRFLKNFLAYYKVEQVDGILADLGVSSHEFDVAERGFSFRFDGKLDMRMNQDKQFNAANVVNEYSENDLIRIFREYGEIKNAGKLAATIVSARQIKALKTISQFLECISPCMPKKFENKYLAKVFQALRIEVNSEIDVLKDFLSASLDVLKQGGRLVVLTYHSLEDRLVKNFIRTGNFEGKIEKDFYGNVQSPFLSVNKKVIVPGENEILGNPRSRSAKLRIAEKL